MKFEVMCGEFGKALSLAKKAAANSRTLPILSHLLLSVQDDRLMVTGTDLETLVSVPVPTDAVKVFKPGSYCVPVSLTEAVVKAAFTEKWRLVLSEDEMELKITGHEVDMTIKGITAAEFPAFAPGQGEPVVFDGPLLKQRLCQAITCASKDQSRPTLTGVYFEVVSEDCVRLVSADGFRMAVVEMAMQKPKAVEFGLILPATSLKTVAEVIDAGRVEMRFVHSLQTGLFNGVGGQQEKVEGVEFRSGDRLVRTLLIGGKFPDYRQIIPKSFGAVLNVERTSLLGAVKQVLPYALDMALLIKFEFNPDRKQVTISASSSTAGEGITQVVVESMDGEPFHTGFNGRYIFDILSVIGADFVRLELGDKANYPARLSPVGSEAEQFIVMPMHINW